jgi:hypothetical protein
VNFTRPISEAVYASYAVFALVHDSSSRRDSTPLPKVAYISLPVTRSVLFSLRDPLDDGNCVRVLASFWHTKVQNAVLCALHLSG